MVSVRLTTPVKWFRPVTLIVGFAGAPAWTGPEIVMDIVKSLNWNVAVTLCTIGVLVPMIVAV